MAEVQTNTQMGELSQRFIEFVMMHAQNAALFLGQIPNPKTGEGEVNLELAKMFIDQLGMIQEKTRGNLTNEEATVLRNALSNLQMAFVEVSQATRGGGAPAAAATVSARRRQAGTDSGKFCENFSGDTGRTGIAQEIHEELRRVTPFCHSERSGVEESLTLSRKSKRCLDFARHDSRSSDEPRIAYVPAKSQQSPKEKKNGAKNGIVADPVEAAEEAGLRYVSDDQPGYSRKRNGDGFNYFDTEGKPIRDEQRILAHQSSRHSTGLHGRLDLSVAERSHPGDGTGRATAQTISLSRTLARSA